MTERPEHISDEFKTTGLRDFDLFIEIYNYLLLNTGNALTPAKVAEDIRIKRGKLSHNTVRKYMETMVKCGIFIELERVYVKNVPTIHQDLQYSRHYYYGDPVHFSQQYFNAVSSTVFRSSISLNESFFRAEALTRLCHSLRKHNGVLRSGVIVLFGKNEKLITTKSTINVDFVLGPQEVDEQTSLFGIVCSEEEAIELDHAFKLVKGVGEKHILRLCRSTGNVQSEPYEEWI